MLSSNCLVDYHFNGDSQCLPLYRYKDGIRLENITDWGLKQFREHYAAKPEKAMRSKTASPSGVISKLDIFHYVYAVLHHPAYREKYKINLTRDLPRIPFYEDFWQWAGWGKALMDLHLNYETVEPYKLERKDAKPDGENPNALALLRKAKLKADKATGTILVDGLTTLSGVPAEAWEYKLGNRSALEWVLERYKEHQPSDPTIRERFNTYRLADYKEQVIDLLMRVCTVSLETVRIVSQMPK